MGANCWVENGEVWFANPKTGVVGWHGMVLERPVLQAVPVPHSSDYVVLVAWLPNPGGDLPNVVRVRADGTIVWRAPVPAPGHEDYYTAIQWGRGGLGAYAASGFGVRLDPDDGRILERNFVK